jgi:uncharacterized membrane protein
MNVYIIGGILLIALGTGVMFYGQHVKSKVDSAEVSKVVQNKVDDVLKRIDEVRGAEKDKASDGKINQIEQEFQTWAAGFLKDRERKKIELARTHLDSVDVQLKISNELGPIFEYVLKTIDSMTKAYNAESGETIKVNFPPLPPNLYSEEARNYGGKVIFPHKAIWHIQFLASRPPKSDDLPTMYITFEQEEDKRSRSDSYCSISIISKEKSFGIRLIGPDIPIAKGVEGTYRLDSYSDSLKTIMRSLFEAQLLRD